MSNIAERDRRLNQMILEGKALEAFEELYADDVVMEEGVSQSWSGKETNREREQQFFASIAELHELSLHGQAVGDDRSYSEWTFDVTFKDGSRKKLVQVAARTWKDGKVVHERFYAAG